MVHPDGGIYAGGLFTILGGVSRSYLGRITTNGVIDMAFSLNASDLVSALAVQADGNLLIGGNFSTLGGAARSKIARCYPGGVVDLEFDAGGISSSYPPWGGSKVFNSMAVQIDGRILVGGGFTAFGGQPRNYIARLNPDGSVDDIFNPGADSDVYGLAIQPDGRILVGGEFTSLGGSTRIRFGRLDNTDFATSTLTTDGTTVLWLRGGPGPEVWRTTFEVWGGTGWTNLGAGTRIAGGWQAGGFSLSTKATVRAQGYAIGGFGNSSAYLVEEGLGPPVISLAPVSRTNFLGTTASFSAWVVGSGPVDYRWRKGGVELQDGGNLSGSGTPNLTLANVQPGDQGLYSVVATNTLGSVASVEIFLAVVPLNLSATGPGLGWTTNRQFKMQLSGTAGWPVAVEASTNHFNWLPLTCVWVGPGAAEATDAAAINYPARYYRAQPVP